MKVSRICQCTMLLFAVASVARAAEPDRFYVSLDIGRVFVEDAEARFGTGDGTSWRLLGGFQLSRYFAVEAGYVDLGSIDRVSGGPFCARVAPGTTLATLPPFACTHTTSIEARGAVANIRGSVPLGERFALSGFLGATYLDVTANEYALVFTPDLGAPCCYRSIETRRGGAYDVAPSFGASISWRMLSKLDLSIDWTRLQDVHDEQVGYFFGIIDQPIYLEGTEVRGEYDLFSLGVRFRF